MDEEDFRHTLQVRLQEFSSEQNIRGKGPLSVMLVITRSASRFKPPFAPAQFITPKGGQVAGLGKSAVQRILLDHGIIRVLAEEGGRTSRGSLGRMQAYITFLNELDAHDLLDFKEIENWWIDRVKEFFASMPLRLKDDPSKSLRHVVAELMETTLVRQRECPGTMIVGAVMQHLVGAKLEIALPEKHVEHRGFSVADAPAGRKGDFVVCDSAIHVTTAPTESLLEKCRDNLAENLRPIVVTTQSGVGGAEALAQEAGIADRAIS